MARPARRWASEIKPGQRGCISTPTSASGLDELTLRDANLRPTLIGQTTDAAVVSNERPGSAFKNLDRDASRMKAVG